MVYIVDLYNRFENNEGVDFVFKLHGIDWCIRHVELDWGKPLRPYRVDEYEPQFQLYESYDAAKAYVDELMRLDGRFI